MVTNNKKLNSKYLADILHKENSCEKIGGCKKKDCE